MGHVSLITLGVDDLERATRFYLAWGFERSDASVDGAVTFLRAGAVALGLFGRDELGVDAGQALPPAPGPVTLAMNLPSRDEVDRRLAAGVEAGGRIARAAAPTDWGGYTGYLADPDGHLWELAHNPGFPLDAEGRVTLP